MKFILFLSIILLSSCVNNKEKIISRQLAIQKEMEQVKAFYYKKTDSLQMANKADTNSTELNKEFSLIDRAKIAELLKLQKEYDSLERKLKRH